MLTAVAPVPARDLPLGRTFANAHSRGGAHVTIGRIEDNVVSAIKLNDGAPGSQRVPEKLINMVSRRHAELEVVQGQLMLKDLRAVNGTYINDARMEGGSRRVLQEDDVVSLGGPINISLRGTRMPNPWTWRVRQLHEFLASYAHPSRLQAPPAQAATAAGQHLPVGDSAPGREVYSFSPSAAGSTPAGTAAVEVQQQGSPLGQVADTHAIGEEEVIDSPEPPADGTGPPGSIVVEPAPPPQQQSLDSDSEERAEIAALEALENNPPHQPTNLPALQPQSGMRDVTQGVPTQVHAPQQQQLQDQHDEEQQLPNVWHPPPIEAPGAPRQAPAPTIISVPAPAAEPTALELGPGGSHIAVTAAGRQQHASSGRPASPPELIDLTGDSPLSQQARGHAMAQGAGGSRQAQAAPEHVNLVEQTDVSPNKRRSSRGQQADQGAKRARASPDAPARVAAAAVAAPGTQTGEPSVAAAAAQEGSAPPSDLSSRLQEEMRCPICQDLLVVTHVMVPCGHCFCGECLAGWLANGRKNCPSCREDAHAKPVRQHAMDNMVEMLASKMPADDVAARVEKQHSWEMNKARFEQQLAAPWSHGGANRAGRRGGDTDGSGLLSAIAASILGSGGSLGFGANPLMLLDPLSAGAHMGGLGMEVPGWGGGGARARRSPAVVARHPPAPEAPPAAPEFRVEVAPQHSAQVCAACGHGIEELTTRIGMRLQGPRRRGGTSGWVWHHLNCLPAPVWREARVNGVANLRGIPAPDQARVRQRLQLARQ